MRKLIIVLLACCALPVLADQEVAPYYYVTTASNLSKQSAVFAMRPPEFDQRTGRVTREGGGIAYRQEADGTLKEIYRIEGWYGQVAISADGRSLIRLPPWSRGRAPQTSDVAVAFYLDGKLLKQYSPLDLLKDPGKVIVTSSHYNWQGPTPSKYPRPENAYQDHDKTFRVYTIDGLKYVFDVMTGEIKTVSPVVAGDGSERPG